MGFGVGELFFLVLHRQAPGGVVGSGHGSALSAWFDELFGRPLECTRFLEAPMPSLFHVELPWIENRAWKCQCIARPGEGEASRLPGPLGPRLRPLAQPLVVRSRLTPGRSGPGCALRRSLSSSALGLRRAARAPAAPFGAASRVNPMADELDVGAMLERFKARAKAVRQRGIPPVEGPERKRFMDQARIDFQDYAIIGDATAHLEDGILTLTVDLRPHPED